MSRQPATVLERILAETRAELERRKRELPLAEPDGEPRPPGRLRAALEGERIAVIAEFKRRSPSAGVLREVPEIAEIVPAYARGGAAALSILTEGPNFGGSLADLRRARALCDLPLLRKDFILDPYQLLEAHAAGADAVLLICAALADAQLTALHARAGELGLDVLVEVHDHDELRRALALGAAIIGVNNRDLRDFSVDVGRTERLLEEIPGHVIVVSESGIAEPAQLEALERLGVRAVLVGEALMRSAEPAVALGRLLGLSPTVQDI